MRIRLGPGREFDLIRSLLGAELPLPAGVRVGPGDDAAVLEGGVVVSCDLTVEGVHFRRDWVTLREAGYRAAAAALSDLAAMAAEPLGALLALAVPPSEAEPASRELQAGAAQACQREGVQILGGDLSASPGPVALDVVVLGRARRPLLRSGSLPGDEVWVTGWLGGSAGAVHLWERGAEPPPELREAFTAPRPRIKEALWLAERAPLRALVDLSDGLAGDAGHLAAASGVAILLHPGAVPLHPGLASALSSPEEALRLALTGGEDYELCFTAPPGAVEALVSLFLEAFGVPLTRVGEVGEGEGVALRGPGGESLASPGGGFSHFRGEEEG